MRLPCYRHSLVPPQTRLTHARNAHPLAALCIAVFGACGSVGATPAGEAGLVRLAAQEVAKIQAGQFPLSGAHLKAIRLAQVASRAEVLGLDGSEGLWQQTQAAVAEIRDDSLPAFQAILAWLRAEEDQATGPGALLEAVKQAPVADQLYLEVPRYLARIDLSKALEFIDAARRRNRSQLLQIALSSASASAPLDVLRSKSGLEEIPERFRDPLVIHCGLILERRKQTEPARPFAGRIRDAASGQWSRCAVGKGTVFNIFAAEAAAVLAAYGGGARAAMARSVRECVVEVGEEDEKLRQKVEATLLAAAVLHAMGADSGEKALEITEKNVRLLGRVRQREMTAPPKGRFRVGPMDPDKVGVTVAQLSPEVARRFLGWIHESPAWKSPRYTRKWVYELTTTEEDLRDILKEVETFRGPLDPNWKSDLYLALTRL